MEKDVPLPFGDADEPKRDWTKTLDLNRTTLTRDMVERYIDAMQRQQVAAEDIKIITASAKEAEYKPKEIAAMKDVAKLRMSGKEADAKEKLEALERIAAAVGMDLFSWGASRL